MDVDWTVPIHPDHSEQGMDQGTTHDTFLEDQDAMDTILWGDVPILSIEPRPGSEDAIGLGAESIMDWGCLCDFPPLYCQQHGVHGNFSVDNDLPLPSFGPEQTTTYPDNVMEPLELAPGFLELTEANRNDHVLSPSPFEMGHARPNLPSNDQTHSYTANHSRDPIKPLVKQPSRRSDISSKNRTILSAYFWKNRYPDTREMNELQKRTSLDKKCVKTWFSNARQRTARLRSPVASSPQESRERSVSETPSQASTSVSAESLRELDRVSPARSTTSLERYLAAPLTEEAIPSTAIDLLKDNYSLILRTGTTEQLIAELKRTSKFKHRILRRTNTMQSELEAPRQYNSRTRKDSRLRARMSRALLPTNDVAGSIAGSDSSMTSVSSAGSWISQTSVDSRGSRKGRRSWVQTPDQLNATASPSKTEEGKTSATTELRKPHPWYCTWPSCLKSFQFRSAWDRHEAAVHYWPYHWVCNLGEQPSMLHEDAASRIFYRDDQLLVHMRGRHHANVTKNSVSTLRQVNPKFDRGYLRCGFCFQTLYNWKGRQDHVAAHIEKGLPKSSWLGWKKLVLGSPKDRKPSDELVLPSWDFWKQCHVDCE